jgi:uncharacterized protein (TIGR02246 family)
VPVTPQEIFERYVRGLMTHDADAMADLFTADGVFEAPLVAPGGHVPSRVEGREEIRAFLTAYHQRPAIVDRKVNVGESRYVLHTTADPDVFITEVDAVMDVAGESVTVSQVKIYRIRDGKIAVLRDYFAPHQAD